MSRRLALSSALLAVVLVGGCGGSPATTATAPSTSALPASSAPATPPSSGTSSPAADSAPIDGTCPTSNTIPFAKTKFVLHAGLAFGAFHRYLYKPFKAGTFRSGQKGRVLAFTKAAASALFVKREIRLAVEDVKASPALCNAIAAPLANLGNGITGAIDQLKNGDAQGITAAESAVGTIESKAAGAGVPITEDPNAPSS